MDMGTGLTPARLTKIPSDLASSILTRGEWSYCALDHSRLEAIELEEEGSPFHHLALPLEPRPLHFRLKMDGRARYGRNAPGTVAMIEAGATGRSRWDGAFESACLYFTDDALRHALGNERANTHHRIRTGIDSHAPVLARLINALYWDALKGQPHGSLIGDAIFLALAAQVSPQVLQRRAAGKHGEAWRVRNALDFIHASLTEELSIVKIAAAAGTSPYYLNHAFRAAIGCSIWQYVLRERARFAFLLIQGRSTLLTEIAYSAGFSSYAGFVAIMRREFGHTPAKLASLAGTRRRAD